MNLSSRSRVTPRAMIGGAAALGAVILGTATQAGKTKGMDRAVRRRVKPKRHPPVVKLAKGISDFASPDVHPLVALVASVCVSAARGRPSVAPLIASASASGIDKAARFLGSQRRPPMATHHKGHDRFAFPSGHTAAATAIALATTIELGDGCSATERVGLYSLAGVWAAAVEWSRLQLDEHWFDDVLGGWSAGIAIAIASTAFDDSFSRETPGPGLPRP